MPRNPRSLSEDLSAVASGRVQHTKENPRSSSKGSCAVASGRVQHTKETREGRLKAVSSLVRTSMRCSSTREARLQGRLHIRPDAPFPENSC
jgi:hypothetical protein